jgi:hypothetical protein
MNKSPRSSVLALLALLVFFATAAHAQTPYPSLAFAREKNSEGTTDYVLRPIVEEIHKSVGGSDKPFQIVGVVARPSKEAAVLLFANAQKELQLYTQADTSVVITIDSVALGNLKYELAAKNEDPTRTVKLEIANVLITLRDLQKISSANSVVVKFGAVVYQLDKENREALRYLVAEIEKDQKTN